MRFAGQTPGIASFLNDGPDYGAVADLGMRARSKEKQTAHAMEAKTHIAGLDAMALVKSSEHQARGIEAGGQAQAAATRASGMGSMFSSIAGGIGKMDLKFGGKSNVATNNVKAGLSPGLGIPISDYFDYGYDPNA